MNMEFNKIFGAVLVAGITAMVAGMAADVVIQPGELEKNAYHIEVNIAYNIIWLRIYGTSLSNSAIEIVKANSGRDVNKTNHLRMNTPPPSEV